HTGDFRTQTVRQPPNLQAHAGPLFRFALFPAYTSLADDFAHARHVRFDRIRQLLWRPADSVHAIVEKLLPDVRLPEYARDFLVQAVDDGSRCPDWRKYAGHIVDLVTWQPGCCHRNQPWKQW